MPLDEKCFEKQMTGAGREKYGSELPDRGTTKGK